MLSLVGVVTAVTSAITGAVVSVVDSSLSSLQEMIVRLKQEISKMNKNFFIFFLNTKSKILLFCVLGEPYIYHNLEDFTRIGDFTWRVTDCEELEGVTHRRWCILLFLQGWNLKNFQLVFGNVYVKILQFKGILKQFGKVKFWIYLITI